MPHFSQRVSRGISVGEGSFDWRLTKTPTRFEVAAHGCDASFDPFFQSPSFFIDMRATFICGDARQIDVISEIPGTVDFVLMRHFQFAIRDPQAVKEILSKALNTLTRDGKVLFTSFCKAEHEVLINLLGELPCEVVFEGENPHAMPVKKETYQGQVAIDQFVCLIRRK